MNRRGFILPLALVLMVVLSFVAVTALQVTTADFQANHRTRLATRALFAAEAGAAQTVAGWSGSAFPALAAGDSASTGWIQLPDGGLFNSTVLRIDDGSGVLPLFRILTEGRASRASSARRRLIFVVESVAATPCCNAGVQVQGRLRVRGPEREASGGRGGGGGGGGSSGTFPPQVDGVDRIPDGWDAFCPVSLSSVPGVVVNDEDNIEYQVDGRIEGLPAVVEDPSMYQGELSEVGGVPWDAIAASASIRFTGNSNTLRGQIRPRAFQGECDTSDTQNWGAPELPGSACWNHLPIIHAEGNLTIDADGTGQGLLLVDGDLVVSGDFHFYGVVAVKGNFSLRNESSVTGGIVVGNEPLGFSTSEVVDDAQVRYSSCVAARAPSGESRITFLPGRHWFEIP